MSKKIFFILITFASLLIFDPIIPIIVKEIMYSFSLSVKSLILFILPLIIFGLLFKTVLNFSNGATKILAIILGIVCCSNASSTFLSHFVGEFIYKLNFSLIKPINQTDNLNTLWNFTFPKLVSNDIALFSAIFLGIVLGRTIPTKAILIATQIDKIIQKLLSGIVYIIPFFILGFIIKIRHEGTLLYILKDYSQVLALIVLSQFTYILTVCLILNRFSFKKFVFNVKNLIPSMLSGFMTMSSAASMPLTIMSVKANTRNKDLASSTVPLTVNIHLVGDCFAIPILAYAILKGFNLPEPSLYQYMIFTFYFVIAKFSVAAIPGGGILVMLPILEKYFGFNTEMLSLITALYILFDPIVTSANVLGNGIFAKFIDNLFLFFKKSKIPATQSILKVKTYDIPVLKREPK